jgi:hypothetical protein
MKTNRAIFCQRTQIISVKNADFWRHHVLLVIMDFSEECVIFIKVKSIKDLGTTRNLFFAEYFS